MRGLVALVVGMGVLIVAGVATLAVTILHRMSVPGDMPAPRAEMLLSEPPGTRIVAAAGAGEGIAVTLQGGGPDRVVILAADGRRLGEIRLAK